MRDTSRGSLSSKSGSCLRVIALNCCLVYVLLGADALVPTFLLGPEDACQEHRSMESKPRVATHLYHVCACGFDISKIHINTFINTCVFMYQGGGGNSHPWAALSLPVLIHMQSSLWGGDSDWSCIDLYRSVSRNVDTAACIEY